MLTIQIVVLDQDQGQSGSSATGRDAFQSLIAEVGLGHAGAVLSLEVSRLARSCSDWYRLLEICAFSDTLVIDEEGVYDPKEYNDRLLLGFKGTMSEAELHWLCMRLQGGKLQKAQNGQLRFRLPAGLIYDPAKCIVLDPDEEVQNAVRLLFDLFVQYGSALMVVKYFSDHNLRFPNRLWGKEHDEELIWEPLRNARVLSALHNPAYAGCYVYGRTTTRTSLLPGESPRVKGRTRKLAPEDWPIVLHDVHPGYISWEQYMQNQQRLDDNRTNRQEERRSAVREGAALLQGIVVCGRCGRRMTVSYQDRGIGTRPLYVCAHTHRDFAAPTCQTLCGEGIDATVAQVFLEALKRKQLLRMLVKDVTLTRREKVISVAIRWQTEACTLLEVAPPPRSYDARRTDPAVVARIRELTANHSDPQIADILNAEGFIPGLKGTFTASKVQWIRYAYKIACGCPDNPAGCVNGQRGDGRYSTQAAAQLLNVDISTIDHWCDQGRLDAIRSTPRGPRWVRLTPEIIAVFRKQERQH